MVGCKLWILKFEQLSIDQMCFFFVSISNDLKQLWFFFLGTGNAYAFVRYENLDMAHRCVIQSCSISSQKSLASSLAQSFFNSVVPYLLMFFLIFRAKFELSGQYIGKFQCKIGYGKANPSCKVWVSCYSLKNIQRFFLHITLVQLFSLFTSQRNLSANISK